MKRLLLANLSRRERLLFNITLALILLSLTYHFVFKRLGANWIQLNEQILEKERILKRNIRYIQQQDKIKDIYQEYAEYIKSKGSDEEEIAALLNEVEEIIRRTPVHISDIRPKSIEEFPFYKKYNLEMNCEASLEKYIEFVYALQKSTQLIRVEKIKLSTQGKDNPLLKARLLITKVSIAE